MKLFAALAAAVALAAPSSALALDGGLAGWWSLNEGKGVIAHDGSVHDDDGVLTGGTAWVGAGRSGSLSFDGVDGQVSVPDKPALEPTQLTVAAWVRSSGSPGRWRYVVAKGADGCLNASWGLDTGPGGGAEFYVANTAASVGFAPGLTASSIWDGKWHFLAGTYDGAMVRLYMDGVQVGGGLPYNKPIAYGMPTSNDLLIGNYAGCPLGFSGTIAGVQLWPRALTAKQIRADAAVSGFWTTFGRRLTFTPGYVGAPGAGANG